MLLQHLSGLVVAVHFINKTTCAIFNTYSWFSPGRNSIDCTKEHTIGQRLFKNFCDVYEITAVCQYIHYVDGCSTLQKCSDDT